MRVVFKIPRIRKSVVEELEGSHHDRLRLRCRLHYPNYVFSAASNGYLLAYGGRGGKIFVYALESLEEPKELMRIKAHGGSVMDLQRIGDTLLSCSKDATIKAWKDGKELFVLKGHEDCVRSIAIRNDYLVSVSMDGRTLLRDLKSKEVLCELSKHTHRVVHVRNHENFFVDVTIDGLVRVYDVEERKKIRGLDLEVHAMGVAINRPYAAISTTAGITILNIKEQKIEKTIAIPALKGLIRRISRARDSIAMGGEFLRVVDDPLGDETKRPVRGHDDRIYNVVYHEGLLFSCSLDRTLGIRTDELVKKRIYEKEESGEKKLVFECSDPGNDKAPERLVKLFPGRPVYCLKLACGKCLKDLVEKLLGLGLLKESSEGLISAVPPEDPKSLKPLALENNDLRDASGEALFRAYFIG